MTSEHLSHLEGLGQETLDLTGTGHSQLVLLRQLIHTQDGNDILKRFVVLQEQAKQSMSDSHRRKQKNIPIRNTAMDILQTPNINTASILTCRIFWTPRAIS